DWGLQGLGHRYAHQLSGGQLQRMAWIRASIHKPALILADEPTSHLDRNSALHFHERVRACARSGCTVLISTHDQELADLCDEVYTLTARGLVHVS
ncbi:MAG: ATP-binding cassette domain-containing protein, partial [Pseudomonadota bacterium]